MPNFDRSFFKRGYVKLSLFLMVIFLLQLYIGTNVRIPIGEEKIDFHNLDLLKKYISNPLDVLYFGDSTNWYTADNDTDKRPIVSMLRHKMPGLKVKSITHGAYHMEVYEAFCYYLLHHAKYLPRLVIIPVNIRSFSPHWDLEPRYQFEREISALKGGMRKAFYTPLRVFKYRFNVLEREEFENLPVFKRDRKIGTIKQMKGTKKELILRYMFPFTVTHRKLQALDGIAKLFEGTKTKLLLYITPIDFESGEKFLPGEFKNDISRKIDIVKSIIRKNGSKLLDITFDLDKTFFAWESKSGPNEHLNQEGREYVAKKIAMKAKQILSEQESP